LTTPKKVSGPEDIRLFPFADLSDKWEGAGVQKGNQLTSLSTKNGAN
jgi:hypothetical protein